MAPVIWSVKTCVLGPLHPLSPSVPAEAGRLLVCVLPGHQCIWFRGEPTQFPVGVNKSYVIATADLWLFIHASNLLSLTPLQIYEN